MKMILYRAGSITIAIFILFFTSVAQQTGNAGEKGMKVDNQSLAQSKGSTYALIVGISSYKKLPRLNYADSDAIAFRNFLTSKAGGNVPSSNIRLYLNDNDSVTGSTIYNLGLRNWLSKRDLKKGDRIYIYLSGHGDSELGTSYFLTSQCNPVVGYQSNDALQISTIKDFIRYITPLGVQVIFIFDACRTNEKRTAGGQVELNNFIRTEQVGGEILMIAADAGETSIEDRDFGGGHGLFTYYLLLGMSGYADSYPDGKITFNELENYVKRNVYNEAQKRKHEQTPYFNTVDRNPVVAFVDTNYFNGLVKADSLHKMLLGNEEVYAARSGSASKSAGMVNRDSNALVLYNAFSNALRDQRLLGNNSADTLYMQLEKNYPTYPLTDDARYLLANEFINYAQRKINIHINGKDISYVNNVKKTLLLDSTGLNPLSKEVKELERVMKVKFGDAAKMMQRAMQLLKDDTSYIRTLQTKLWFLEAKSYYDELNSSISYDSAIRLMRRAIVANPNASYCFNLLGQLFRINVNKKMQDSSEIMFTKSIALSPNWVYPYRNLAGYYREKMNYAKAIDNYTKAISIDSTDAETYNEMGILYYTKKEYAQSEFYYKKSLSADSSQKYASRNLGLLYSVQDRKALSEKYYLLSIKIDSNYASSYYDLAYQYSLTGKNAMAENYYKKAIEKNPWNADYHNDLGLFYYNQGKDSLAIIYYQQAIVANPKYVIAHNNLALLYKNEKKFDLSKKYYSKSIELDPNNANAYNGLGLIYYTGNNNDSAEYNFKKSIQSDSALKYPYYNLGNIYNHRSKYTIAEKYYLKAISLDSAYSYAYYMLAGLYKKMKQYKLAEINYLKALRFDSTNVYILNDLGVLFNDTGGDSKEIEKYYKKAIEVNPKYMLAYTNLALFYKTHKQYELAEKYFRQMLLMDSANATAYNSLGSLYYQQKNKDELAESYFKKSIHFDSTYAYPYYNLGNLYNKQKQYPLAEKNFLKAIHADSTYTYAYYMLAGQYNLLQNTILAEKYYLKALQTDSLAEDILYDLGKLYINLGKDSLAERYFIKVIGMDSAYSFAYYRLAGVYKKLHRDKLSENNYFRSIHFDSANVYALNDLAVLYDDGDRTKEAEKYYKKAIGVDPKYLLAHNNLALLYKKTKQYELAEACYERIVSIDTANAGSYNDLGLLYYQQNKNEKAEAAFKKAIQINKKYKYSYSNLGNLYVRTEKYDLAETHYLKAIQIDSNDATLYNALGNAYQYGKKFDKAKESYLHAVRIDSTFADAYANLGDMYKSAKESALALASYTKALRIDSGYRYATQQLALLYLENLNDPQKAAVAFEKLVAKYPSDSNYTYDLACAYARLDNTSKALYYLEAAIKIGMKDVEWMRKDTDLISLRKDPGFEKLIQKYFPGK